MTEHPCANPDAEFPLDWPDLQEKAAKRDNYSCAACGNDETLYTLYRNPPEMDVGGYGVDNLVTACETHSPPFAQTDAHLYFDDGPSTEFPPRDATVYSIQSKDSAPEKESVSDDVTGFVEGSIPMDGFDSTDASVPVSDSSPEFSPDTSMSPSGTSATSESDESESDGFGTRILSGFSFPDILSGNSSSTGASTESSSQSSAQVGRSGPERDSERKMFAQEYHVSVAREDMRRFGEYVPFIRSFLAQVAVFAVIWFVVATVMENIPVVNTAILTVWNGGKQILAGRYPVTSPVFDSRSILLWIGVMYGVNLLARDYREASYYYPLARVEQSISHGTVSLQIRLSAAVMAVSAVVVLDNAFLHILSFNGTIVSMLAGVAYVSAGLVGMVAVGDAVAKDIREAYPVRAFVWDWMARIGLLYGWLAIVAEFPFVIVTGMMALPIIGTLGYEVRRSMFDDSDRAERHIVVEQEGDTWQLGWTGLEVEASRVASWMGQLWVVGRFTQPVTKFIGNVWYNRNGRHWTYHYED